MTRGGVEDIRLKCFETFDPKQAKMFRNVRRTCWNKYEDEIEQKLNERILSPVAFSKLSQ